MKTGLAFFFLSFLVPIGLIADEPSPKLPPSQKDDVPAAAQLLPGKILTATDAVGAEDGDYTGETLYLVGDFVVTARAKDRAVLRFAGKGGPVIRIIAGYPPAAPIPFDGARFTRDHTCGFLITKISRSPNGEITIHARDTTIPKLASAAAQSPFEIRGVSDVATEQTQEYVMQEGEGRSKMVFLISKVLLDHTAIEDAWTQGGPQGTTHIYFRFTEAGSKRFDEIMRVLRGKRIGFLLAGQLLSAPEIGETSPGERELALTAHLAQNEATALLEQLKQRIPQ